MSIINVLDNNTINLIAAGEVVERPGSVVKELVENAMDSGANAITVEIKQGGIEFIRVTDNGSGIYKDDIKLAFKRHATSKIKTAEDLLFVSSMGFRGEALSSISSVAKVELITKRQENLIGFHYEINAGEDSEIEEIGAPDGTTIIVRNLFYNIPARRKFLKSENSEANNIRDIMEHLALARPEISFNFIVNGKTKFQTTGSSDIKEIIYRLYGKEIKNEMIPIDYEIEDIKISGYLGRPSINRSNRNFETYFINKRYIQSKEISTGIEEGYREFLMQHKFPFCVLHINMDFSDVDVNVHPAKLQVKFLNNFNIHDLIAKAVGDTLFNREMIPNISLINDTKINEDELKTLNNIKAPEVFENVRRNLNNISQADDTGKDLVTNKNHGSLFTINFENDDFEEDTECNVKITDSIDINSEQLIENSEIKESVISDTNEKNITTHINSNKECKPVQLSFYEEENFLSEKARQKYRIIGQVFDTYWIIEYGKNIFFVDQHAAHEKVNYERLMKRIKNEKTFSQYVNPPIVLSLSASEIDCLSINKKYLEKIGFEWDDVGGSEIALTAIPGELFLNKPDILFMDILEELTDSKIKGLPEVILERIATMACKASVKGGNTISLPEINELLDELLTLDNPYNCPHGRPTIFSISQTELEKKFKRIVD